MYDVYIPLFNPVNIAFIHAQNYFTNIRIRRFYLLLISLFSFNKC